MHAGQGLIVLLWFAGGAVAIVWAVFGDPAFDVRLLIVGALLPDIVDGPFGGARVAHSIVTAVALLTVTMLTTIGRRPLRRRLLAVPIGVLLHLVLDGAFGDARLFWWPLSGLSVPHTQLPSVARGWWNVPLEVVGAILLVWLLPRATGGIGWVGRVGRSGWSKGRGRSLEAPAASPTVPPAGKVASC